MSRFARVIYCLSRFYVCFETIFKLFSLVIKYCTLTEKAGSERSYRLEVVFFVLWHGRQGTSRHVFDHPEGHGEKINWKFFWNLFLLYSGIPFIFVLRENWNCVIYRKRADFLNFTWKNWLGVLEILGLWSNWPLKKYRLWKCTSC